MLNNDISWRGLVTPRPYYQNVLDIIVQHGHIRLAGFPLIVKVELDQCISVLFSCHCYFLENYF